jgi:hypothetical protein
MEPQAEPEPDYSDNESGNDLDDVDPTYNANIWQIRKENVKDNLHVLSKEEYEQIISAAGMGTVKK